MVRQELNDNVVKELCDLIRRSPFSEAQIRRVYEAASLRVTHKTCALCKRVRPEPELMRNAVDGDIRRAQWECKDGCRR